MRLFIVVFGVFLAVLGAMSQFPVTITPDAAMHAEIAELVGEQGYVTSWEPFAATPFTYPPLFHYLAWSLPLNAIDAVRSLGLVLWLLFPIAMYFLVGTFDKRAGLIAAFLTGLVPSFSNVFIYSEFPQLLGMLLFVWQWFFLRKERYVVASVFAGLVVLSHPFLAVIAVTLHLIYFLEVWKTDTMVKYTAIPVIVALPWAPAYFQIVKNALAGSWENVTYNAVQPVFGFWSGSVVVNFLFGLDGLTPLLLLLAFVGLFYVKDWFVRGFFAFGLVFTAFHLPFTQLKIFDMFALVVVVLASLGLIRLGRYWKVYVVFVVLVLGFLQVQHFDRAATDWFNPEIAPTQRLVDAAEWLGEYDDTRVRIYSHQAPTWVGVLSGKLALDPYVTFLEAFSVEYKEQLDVREKIRVGLEEGRDVSLLLGKYDVKYVLVPVGIDVGYEQVYLNREWAVYQIY